VAQAIPLTAAGWKRAAALLPAAGGAYLLLLRLDRPVRLPPKFRGATLPPGLYLYCGSARGRGGIRARALRHLRGAGRMHWHVDHLTRAATISGIAPLSGGLECALARALLETGARVPVRGFGSSDCRRCPAHLFAFPGTAALLAAVACALGPHADAASARLLLRSPGFLFLVEEDALRGAVEILELPRMERPHEGEQAEKAHEQSDRDEIDENVHGTVSERAQASRSEVRGVVASRPGVAASAAPCGDGVTASRPMREEEGEDAAFS